MNNIFDVIQYDPLTGKFIWVEPTSSKIKIGQLAGTKNKDGYIIISVKGNKYFAHRLAWLYMTGEWPSKEIDHRNRVRDDNSWDNLRLATRKEQQGNYSLLKRNISGMRGVSFHKGKQKWRARISTKNGEIFLGYFIDKQEAQNKYTQAAKEYFGDFY